MSEQTLMDRLVYFFGDGQADAGSEIKNLVGGKGASLGDMTRAGLNVPPGFTISTKCCVLYHHQNSLWPPGLEEEIRAYLARLEELTGRTLGVGADPLLVAVRSGAEQSMPGMMDTVLNVGLNPDCVQALAKKTGNPRAAWEAYQHFLVMFAHTVAGLEDSLFTDLTASLLKETGKNNEEELDAVQRQLLCDRIRKTYWTQTSKEFPTDPFEMLREAINAVFRSWNNERAIAYRQYHGMEGLLGTAVNVQAMCPSEVSGILFTANPVNPALEQILIESSFGLGEAIVLGKVTPDRFVVDKNLMRITEREIARKDSFTASIPQEGRDPAAARASASLTDDQVIELARLGLRVQEHFQTPCDIEWGLSRGKIYLLQSRAIKMKQSVSGLALSPDEEKVRDEEVAALRARAEPGGTVWASFNLSEILPEPTPLTWAIVRQFMSGQGGFGLMYRDLGFDPDPALDEEGIFDLVCGRPYCNLSREPRMQYRTLPFEHPFAALKADPAKALYPQPVFNPSKAGWRFWLFLPAVFFKLMRSSKRLQKLSRSFADRFQKEIAPTFVEETKREAGQDLARLEPAQLLERLNYWIKRTLIDFARDSLKPTALAGVAMGNLERALAKSFAAQAKSDAAAGHQRAQAALRELVMGVHPDPEADLAGGVKDLVAGRLDQATFLKRFGHRGSQEMELSRPRWAEDFAAVEAMVQDSAKHGQTDGAKKATPRTWEQVADEAKLSSLARTFLLNELHALQTYLGLRETAKQHLMRGYALIRRLLVELDRRAGLEGGIFFLVPADLPQVVEAARNPGRREELLKLIGQRRRRRVLALDLPVPQVLFSDDLEAIGRPTESSAGDLLQGVPLSAGLAEGKALVLDSPAGVKLPEEPYILVCSSTDPAWVPLFVRARGLVVETGGVLSHGAIVARDFGLPAVGGVPGVHRRLRTGQRLRVDGATGKVNILA